MTTCDDEISQLAENAAHQMMGTTGSPFEKCEGAIEVFLSNLAMAGLAIGPQSQWQPIETAPKDGTRVLLFVPPYGPSTGHYEPARVNWGPNASLWVSHSVLNKEAAPTHWMPLPTPPTGGESDG